MVPSPVRTFLKYLICILPCSWVIKFSNWLGLTQPLYQKIYDYNIQCNKYL